LNIALLKKHISAYKQNLARDPEKHTKDLAERKERIAYYQYWTKDLILAMTVEGFYEYISKLWAMLIWGNKHYVVDKMIADNGFDALKRELSELIWGTSSVIKRWDNFLKSVKGFGPATISEILCYVYPDQCLLWNRRAYVGLNYLGVTGLPKYNYQMTGNKYAELSGVAQKIAEEMRVEGIEDVNLLTVDYFIWDELQVEENLSKIHVAGKKPKTAPIVEEKLDADAAEFIHNEIRDKLSDIGKWLGFNADTEKKVAEGSKVDTIWESTIGNMGRIIYVFEVQTKGSIDSLIINLLKALNNPAVQGVVAVSDAAQLDKIRKHAEQVPNLGAKLRYWDYKKVLEVHDALEMVYESINSLRLVPQGF
jgi:hypothetical protein